MHHVWHRYDAVMDGVLWWFGNDCARRPAMAFSALYDSRPDFISEVLVRPDDLHTSFSLFHNLSTPANPVYNPVFDYTRSYVQLSVRAIRADRQPGSVLLSPYYDGDRYALAFDWTPPQGPRTKAQAGELRECHAPHIVST